MYVFKDRVVLECLHRTVNAYGRIGEYIRVDATPSCIQFSVANSSSTVIGRTEFPAGLFSGPGATRTVLLKARALDLVLKRVEVENLGTLRLRFRTSAAGQEQAELFVVEPNGVSKQFRINCLETVVLPLDFDSVSDEPCTFACLPAVLKDAFASCETSADEARMQFMPQHISILAKRRGASGTGSSVLNMGLKTIIKLQPTAFRQLSVLTPWQAEFKLKEFRVVLAFFQQLSAETPIEAAFDMRGPTTPFVFSGFHPSCPELSFVFKFMARVSGVRNAEANTWLRVGPQPDWPAAAPRSRHIHARNYSMDAVRRERAARVRRLTSDFTASPTLSPLGANQGDFSPRTSPAAPSQTRDSRDRSESPAPPASLDPLTALEPEADHLSPARRASTSDEAQQAPELLADDSTAELGFTQAEPVARGLFD